MSFSQYLLSIISLLQSPGLDVPGAFPLGAACIFLLQQADFCASLGGPWPYWLYCFGVLLGGTGTQYTWLQCLMECNCCETTGGPGKLRALTGQRQDSKMALSITSVSAWQNKIPKMAAASVSTPRGCSAASCLKFGRVGGLQEQRQCSQYM